MAKKNTKNIFAKNNIKKFLSQNTILVVLVIVVLMGGIVYINMNSLKNFAQYIAKITGISAMDGYQGSTYNNDTNNNDEELTYIESTTDEPMNSAGNSTNDSNKNESANTNEVGGASSENANTEIEWWAFNDEDFLSNDIIVDDGEGNYAFADYDNASDQEDE